MVSILLGNSPPLLIVVKPCLVDVGFPFTEVDDDEVFGRLRVKHDALYNKGGSRHKDHHYDEGGIFFISNFSNYSALHRNALAA